MEYVNRLRKRLRTYELQSERWAARQNLLSANSQSNSRSEQIPMEIQSNSNKSSSNNWRENALIQRQFLLHYELNNQQHCKQVLTSSSFEQMEMIINELHSASIARQKLEVDFKQLAKICSLCRQSLTNPSRSKQKTLRCIKIVQYFFFPSFKSQLREVLIKCKQVSKGEVKHLREIKNSYAQISKMIAFLQEKAWGNTINLMELEFFMEIVSQKIMWFNSLGLLQESSIQQKLRKTFVIALSILQRDQKTDTLFSKSLLMASLLLQNNMTAYQNQEQQFQLWAYLQKAFDYLLTSSYKTKLGLQNYARLLQLSCTAIGREPGQIEEKIYQLINRMILMGITLNCNSELIYKKQKINQAILRLMLECQCSYKTDSHWLDFCLSVVEESIIQGKFDIPLKLALILLCINNKYGLQKMIEFRQCYLPQQHSLSFQQVISEFQTLSEQQVAIRLLESIVN